MDFADAGGFGLAGRERGDFYFGMAQQDLDQLER
jgi:hypothetical protein